MKEGEMRLDGWLKLSEITADLLQQVENTTSRISGALGCIAEYRPQLCSQWLEFFRFNSSFLSRNTCRQGENKKKKSGDRSALLRKLCVYESPTGKAEMRREYSAKEDESSRDSGVQTVDFGRVTVSREEVRGEESKEGKRMRQQGEPSEMKAKIKRLASVRYGGISRLLPATG